LGHTTLRGTGGKYLEIIPDLGKRKREKASKDARLSTT